LGRLVAAVIVVRVVVVLWEHRDTNSAALGVGVIPHD
jgi:hypothetical protein